ncbi:MAG: cytochrome d ubiquinol oxidase subunit II [Nitrospira sp.]|nr:cytochrome d ubiquinol oxidase subunit II [Nitrospira sp.]
MRRQAWDAAFIISSLLLAMAFGTALGNLIRGVPLNRGRYFFVPLWTDFQPGAAPGILAFHGANYLVMKTEGLLYQRAVAAPGSSSGCISR